MLGSSILTINRTQTTSLPGRSQVKTEENLIFLAFGISPRLELEVGIYFSPIEFLYAQ
jgi:hypothetical protein